MISIYGKIRGGTYNASNYYRTMLPLTMMDRLKLPVSVIIDPDDAQLTDEERWRVLLGTDIIWLHQTIEPKFNMFMYFTRCKIDPGVNSFGEMQNPPSFVCGTDDDLFNVTPFNDSFNSLGYKNFEGEEMKEGQKIWARHPITNEPILLWEDGGNCDYAKAKMHVDSFRSISKESELVVSSNERLSKRLVEEGVDQDKIHVLPNLVDFGIYTRVDLAPHPKEIRVLFQGSPTHHEDLWPIRQAMANVVKKHPEVQFIFWGVKYAWTQDFMPKGHCTFLDWVDYRSYPLRLGTIGHDIAIAPLAKTVFNESRSGIKFYESSAIHEPAAVLAQNTGPYGDEIIDGETGMLWNTPEEFETKLCALVVDSKLRKTLAANAKDWVRTERDPAKHVLKLYDRLVKVREARDMWDKHKKIHYRRLYNAERDLVLKEQKAQDRLAAKQAKEYKNGAVPTNKPPVRRRKRSSTGSSGGKQDGKRTRRKS